jgi:hypothetical protein
VLIAIVVAVALATTTSAQQGPGRGGGRGGGWGRNSPYNRLYDPKTVETREGEVTAIEYHTPRNASGRGVHLVLKTGEEAIPVHLGPEWFIENQDTQIEKGDQVKVTGSRVTYQDKPVIIAREVEKGDEVLQLRDDDGFPRWAAWRRRR